MSNRIRLAAAICAFAISSASLADNVRGAWSPPFSWPLIAAHMILTPDGRILSYGTDGNGTQTGFFIYDVWDPNAGTTGGGHLTMPNISGTDIFCSSQVILALERRHLHRGRRQLRQRRHHQHRQQQQQRLQLRRPTRWRAATT